MAKLLIFVAVMVGAFLLAGGQQFMMARALRRASRPLKHDQLDRLFDRLATAAGVDRLDVRVMEQPMVNGLATADGGVYLTSGMVQQYRAGRITGPELASVVAHELGHVALGHLSQRRVIAPLMLLANSSFVAAVLRMIPFLGALVAQLVLQLIAAALSRRGEFEADAYATALMMRAGFGAEPQAKMLEKLPALIPGGGALAGRVSWLSSHPAVPDRVAAIRENAGRWQAQV
ncbi:MAG: M48 family metalloprotease [Pseudomonadota bacterium]